MEWYVGTNDLEKYSPDEVRRPDNSGGGSGGGSGDFSTAQVTVSTPGLGHGADVSSVHIASYSFGEGLYAEGALTDDVLTVPLYKGHCIWYLENEYSVTVSGSATFDDSEGAIDITGDCTITFADV